MDISLSREGDESRRIIYKYFSIPESNKQKYLGYIKNLFKTGELYFSEPKDFNDLFDSTIDFSFEGKEKDINKWLEDFLNSNDIDGTVKMKFSKIFNSRDKNKYAHVASELQTYYKYNRSKEVGKTGIRICCFTDSWDVSPMWAHYASSNQGICIGFEVKYIESPSKGKWLALDFKEPAIGSNDTTYYPLLPITYLVYRPKPQKLFEQDDNYKLKKAKEFMLTKHITWQYEEERRILLVPEENQETLSKTRHLKQYVIKEIIFGFRMSEDSKRELVDSLNNLDVQLYQIVLPKNSFYLEREYIKRNNH